MPSTWDVRHRARFARLEAQDNQEHVHAIFSFVGFWVVHGSLLGAANTYPRRFRFFHPFRPPQVFAFGEKPAESRTFVPYAVYYLVSGYCGVARDRYDMWLWLHRTPPPAS